MAEVHFEWDKNKEKINFEKHGVKFEDAQNAFLDPYRIIHKDLEHSGKEERYYCFGKIKLGIVTVRFTRE